MHVAKIISGHSFLNGYKKSISQIPWLAIIIIRLRINEMKPDFVKRLYNRTNAKIFANMLRLNFEPVIYSCKVMRYFKLIWKNTMQNLLMVLQ